MTLLADGPETVSVRRTAAKLIGLAVAIAVLVILRTPLAVAVGAVVTIALYVVSGLGLPTLFRHLRPMRWFVLVMMVFHVVVGSGTAAAWTGAVTVTGTLVVSVALAGWVTSTTPATAILDVIERAVGPLRFVGIDPARIALLLALALRSLPVMTDLAARIRDATRARGVEKSVRANVVPLVVSGLRHADRLGEALIARGADDPDDHPPATRPAGAA